MNRLTRLCEDTESGKYLSHTTGTYTGIFPDCTLGEVVKRLAYYEDMIEGGELVEVVHGRWIDDTFCSNCGGYSENEYGRIVHSGDKKYCPNCGAKMDRGNNDG